MARTEGNPIKTMLIIIIVLIVAGIAMNVFWNKKINGDKVGHFVGDGTNPLASPPAPSATQTTPVATS